MKVNVCEHRERQVTRISRFYWCPSVAISANMNSSDFTIHSFEIISSHICYLAIYTNLILSRSKSNIVCYC